MNKEQVKRLLKFMWENDRDFLLGLLLLYKQTMMRKDLREHCLNGLIRLSRELEALLKGEGMA